MENSQSITRKDIQYTCLATSAALVFTCSTTAIARKLLDASQLKAFFATVAVSSSLTASYCIYRHNNQTSPQPPKQTKPTTPPEETVSPLPTVTVAKANRVFTVMYNQTVAPTINP